MAKGPCFFCGKGGHFVKECKHKKNKKDANKPNANMMETKVEELVAMVSDMQIGMITELNMAKAKKCSD